MSQDFSKAKIYKITNDYNNDVYVGSTCDLLTKRFSYHKSDYRKERCQNMPIYKLMNEIGFERFRIELIEDYPCQDRYQLRQREGNFIREIGTLNKVIAGRSSQQSQKEYYEANKEHINKLNREYNKEYKKVNKVKIQEYRKEKITCDCGCIICKGDISSHKKTNKHINLMKTIQTQEVC
jgi:hypothetical protein